MATAGRDGGASARPPRRSGRAAATARRAHATARPGVVRLGDSPRGADPHVRALTGTPGRSRGARCSAPTGHRSVTPPSGPGIGLRAIGLLLGKDSSLVKPRLPAVAAAFVAAGALLAPSAFGASDTVVISQVAFRGRQGGNDEHIQMRNISGSPQAIGGWEIWGASQAGTATGPRAKVPDDVTLPAGGRSYLFTNTAAAG